MDSTAENEVASPPPIVEQQSEPVVFTAGFTGSGKEYFRIWLVNLLLTVASLGIYSAWAKVRRLQYFYRNTQLAGATFDFHGDAKAILKGRLLAVILLACYHYAFGFSIMVGAVIAAVLILGLPFLLRSALRFRLSNTSYRGLRFGFAGSVRGAYRAWLPPVATVLLPGALLSIDPQNRTAAAAGVLYLAWPTMHGLMKRYQHRNLMYGNQHASYGLAPSRFYGPYIKAALVTLASVAIAVALALGVATAFEKSGSNLLGSGSWTMGVAVSLVSGYIFFLMAGPYLQVRINNLTWSNTSLPGMSVKSAMTARGMLRLQVANAVLTLLTLGLYRPFAVVRVYRYRLAHITLSVEGDFDDVIAAAAARTAGTAGDGAADFLGVDISW